MHQPTKGPKPNPNATRNGKGGGPNNPAEEVVTVKRARTKERAKPVAIAYVKHRLN